jgi:anti-sigma regulatory factor (Ser/Thr protein kinase)
MEIASSRHASRVLAQSRNAPALARQFVRATLDTWGVGDAFADVPLVTSELVTNAVRHASSDVDVTLDLTPDRLRLEVSDCSDEPPVIGDIDAPRNGGWGLHIVAMIASQWGLESRANGKTVWCEVAIPESDGSRLPGAVRERRAEGALPHRA